MIDIFMKIAIWRSVFLIVSCSFAALPRAMKNWYATRLRLHLAGVINYYSVLAAFNSLAAMISSVVMTTPKAVRMQSSAAP